MGAAACGALVNPPRSIVDAVGGAVWGSPATSRRVTAAKAGLMRVRPHIAAAITMCNTCLRMSKLPMYNLNCQTREAGPCFQRGPVAP
jgi:hypothetical protein